VRLPEPSTVIAGNDDLTRNPTSRNLDHVKFLHRRQWLDSAHGSQDGAARLAEAAAEEAAAAAAMGVRRVGAVEDLRCLDEEIDRDASAAASRYGIDIHATACIEQSGKAINHSGLCLCKELGPGFSLGFGCVAEQTD